MLRRANLCAMCNTPWTSPSAFGNAGRSLLAWLLSFSCPKWNIGARDIMWGNHWLSNFFRSSRNLLFQTLMQRQSHSARWDKLSTWRSGISSRTPPIQHWHHFNIFQDRETDRWSTGTFQFWIQVRILDKVRMLNSCRRRCWATFAMASRMHK